MKARDFADSLRNYTVQTTDQPSELKLGKKNLAKLDRMRRLAAKLKAQGPQTQTHF